MHEIDHTFLFLFFFLLLFFVVVFFVFLFICVCVFVCFFVCFFFFFFFQSNLGKGGESVALTCSEPYIHNMHARGIVVSCFLKLITNRI